MHEIVVLGGGYTGLITAASLAGWTRRRDVHITVVNAGDRFTERLRLHQTATGQQLSDLRIPDALANTNATLTTGWVTAINPTAKTVRIDDSTELGYDTLVYALGGAADTAGVPGAELHAYTMDGWTDAQALARRLAQAGTKAVAICGSGLTGIETAAEIAEQHPDLDVTLIGRTRPGSDMTPRAARHLTAALDRLGVRVITAEIGEVLPDAVETIDGLRIATDVAVWTAGVRVSPLPAAAGISTDERGRIRTDGTLRSTSHPDVYAVGDAAAVPVSFGVLHGTCQSGMPTGVHAAWNIVRELDGRAPARFRFGYLHLPVSLGRGDAVVQFTRGDGSPHRWHLTGRAAVWYKETVSASPWPSAARMVRMPWAGRLAWRR
ncbi:NADH dehydrogenase FAD-containing subunit [Actinoplanes lutulentus]|uniref:NADH dehydrogenase FAD-containing subunit n=1 Tax=Actinoplanes lutulentus TaxID=1287878 RepID=A0A327ZP82_9ACTN|nr:FAD-dependent oxidoreductase [Actinoplanes lutulentus]MBB2944400.1 NADH dehydrogenase FAD-containing subunit [Actinoplanes lutulentus]RAK42368.1 NADH dehydrogenase FAD-containing subunit [Actinoplanes lutulentus]